MTEPMIVELPENLAPALLAQRILALIANQTSPALLDAAALVSSQNYASATGSHIPPARIVVALAGAPGAGKTTMTRGIVENLERAGTSVAVLPLDGFHLANSQLERLGLRAVKGAPHTFDAHGYVATLARVVQATQDVYAPGFHRDIEESYGADVFIPRTAQVILTEGNYLLLDHEPWTRVRELCTQTWYLEPDDELRVDRLVARHIAHGKSPREALDWSLGTDQRNAELIADTRTRADLVVRLGPPTPQGVAEIAAQS